MKGRLSGLLLAGVSLAGMLTAFSAQAAETCSMYPEGAAEQATTAEIDATLGAVPAADRPLHVVYITKTLLNEALQAIAQGVKDGAAARGIRADVQAAKDESSPVEQLNIAQAVLAQKPDALLLSPQTDTNLVPTIKAAQAANIPTVIIIDARTDGASTYLGTDQVQIGRRAAEYLHTLHPDGGEVAQIEGQAGSPNARKRMQGFREGLEQFPNLKLVASQPGNWDRLTALNATTNILRAHPDLVGIYANNDTMALGAVEALRTAGKLKQVAVVGTDGIKAAKRSIADGEMAATIADDLYGEGKISIDLALRLVGCQQLPTWVVSDQALITAENVQDYPDPPAYQP